MATISKSKLKKMQRRAEERKNWAVVVVPKGTKPMSSYEIEEKMSLQKKERAELLARQEELRKQQAALKNHMQMKAQNQLNPFVTPSLLVDQKKDSDTL
jgi:hypothetical protein